MTYREAWEQTRKALISIYPEQEASAIAREVFLRLLHIPPDQRVLKANEIMPQKSMDLLHLTQEELKTGKPIQYITGICDFLGMEMKVESGVLIPRPETEELVLWAEKELKARFQAKSPTILDIGTGSGCIAVTLGKRFPNANISACDISPQALMVATQNAINNQVNVDFFACDILNDATANNHLKNRFYDCMLSNPPYVRHSEKKWIKPNVLDFEPSLALFVDDSDPLLFYKAIGELAFRSLQPGGMLLFEINEYLADDTSILLKRIGFGHVEVRSDLHGKPRFIKAQNASFDFRP